MLEECGEAEMARDAEPGSIHHFNTVPNLLPTPSVAPKHFQCVVLALKICTLLKKKKSPFLTAMRLVWQNEHCVNASQHLATYQKFKRKQYKL